MERDSLSSTGDSCEPRLFCCPTMPSHQRYSEILQSPRPVQDDPPPVCRNVSIKPSCGTGPRVPPSAACWEEPLGGNPPSRAERSLPPLWQSFTFTHKKWIYLLGFESRFTFFPCWSCLALSGWLDPSQEQDPAASFRCESGPESLPSPFPHHLGAGIFHLLLK